MSSTKMFLKKMCCMEKWNGNKTGPKCNGEKSKCQLKKKMLKMKNVMKRVKK